MIRISSTTPVVAVYVCAAPLEMDRSLAPGEAVRAVVIGQWSFTPAYRVLLHEHGSVPVARIGDTELWTLERNER